jgi:hypothetical protein
VGVFIDRKKISDPNSLSISDDELEVEVSKDMKDMNKNNDMKRVKMIDTNEINFDSDEEENNDWNTATITASNLCKSASNLGTSKLNLGMPIGGGDNRPKGFGASIFSSLGGKGGNSGQNDVISFDDDEVISGPLSGPLSSSSVRVNLSLPSPKGLSLPPPAINHQGTFNHHTNLLLDVT